MGIQTVYPKTILVTDFAQCLAHIKNSNFRSRNPKIDREEGRKSNSGFECVRACVRTHLCVLKPRALPKNLCLFNSLRYLLSENEVIYSVLSSGNIALESSLTTGHWRLKI